MWGHLRDAASPSWDVHGMNKRTNDQVTSEDTQGHKLGRSARTALAVRPGVHPREEAPPCLPSVWGIFVPVGLERHPLQHPPQRGQDKKVAVKSPG